MSAKIYAELQQVAGNVLAAFSQGTHKYVEMVPTAGDTSDDPGAPTPVIYPYEGVVRGVSFKYKKDSNVSDTDLQTTMPGGIVEPKLGGFIEQPNGKRGKIVKIEPKPASGPVVAYIVIFQR